MKARQGILIPLLIVITMAFSWQVMRGKDMPSAGEEIFLESSMAKEKAVEGERVIYETRLYSTTPDISSLRLITQPDFSTLPFGKSAADSGLRRVSKDGKEYYSMVIDRYFIGADEAGKYHLQGGRYQIGINRKVRVSDPFWGATIVNRMEPLELTSPSIEFKVGKLPSKGRPEVFSGAVGDFEISIIMPEGEIVAGDNATVSVVISGIGDLTNAPAPDVRQAFRDGLHFRSMTDEKQHYISKGSLGSEMILDCIFSSDAPGTYTLLPISFTFYNPEKKRYVTISTERMEIVVGSRISKGAPPVYHNI